MLKSSKADLVSKIILEKYLIACVKKIPVPSSLWNKGKIASGNEVVSLEVENWLKENILIH